MKLFSLALLAPVALALALPAAFHMPCPEGRCTGNDDRTKALISRTKPGRPHLVKKPLHTAPEMIQGTAEWWVDQLVHHRSIAEFLEARNHPDKYPKGIDWTRGGQMCDRIDKKKHHFIERYVVEVQIHKACARHDFGYRNYRGQGRFTKQSRRKLDNVFKRDVEALCQQYPHGPFGNLDCLATADIYVLDMFNSREKNLFKTREMPYTKPRKGIDVPIRVWTWPDGTEAPGIPTTKWMEWAISSWPFW